MRCACCEHFAPGKGIRTMPSRLAALRRRTGPQTPSQPPFAKCVLFESLEPRLLLSAAPGLDPLIFVPGFGGTMAADTSEAGLTEYLTTRGIAPGKLQLEPLSNAYSD